MVDAPRLDQNAARERRQVQQPEVPQTIEAVTAFYVAITPEGQIVPILDLGQNLEVERQATVDEVKMACHEIYENLDVQQKAQLTAQLVVNAMQQFGAQMQNQAASNKLMEDIKAGRVPAPR